MSSVSRYRSLSASRWLVKVGSGTLVLLGSLAAGLVVACGGGDSGTNPGAWVVTDVTVSPNSPTIEVAETVQLSASVQATGSPAGATTWRSSNTSVATVSSSGLVTGLSVGPAVITATAGGVEGTATVSVTPTTPPTQPGPVTLAPASDNSVQVSWVDQSSDETGFRIEREASAASGTPGAGSDEASGPQRVFSTVGTVGAGTTSFVDTGLDAATTYRYQVRACKGETCSEPRAGGEVTTDVELVITTQTLGAGVGGVAYQDQVSVNGGGGTLAWGVSDGEPPPGLTLSATTGVLSGTPTQAGDFVFTVEVTARGQAVTREYTVTIGAEQTVSGTLFRDDDRDGGRDGGEALVGPALVTFLDGGGAPVESFPAGADGTFSGSLPPGTYGAAVEPTGGLIGDPSVLSSLDVVVTAGNETVVELPMVPGGQAVVGPAGGLVEGPDGLLMTVPAGALDVETLISVVPDPDVQFDGSGFPGFELHPSGTRFMAPVEVTLPVDGGASADGQFFFVDESTGEALREPTVISGDDALLYTSHFSSFFFDPDWRMDATLRTPGAYEYRVSSIPTRLGPGTAEQAEDDIDQGVERWQRAFDEIGVTLTRNDAAADPFLTVDTRSLGPCGADGPTFGRTDRLASLTRDRTLYLNDDCLFSTAVHLSRDVPPAIAIQGVVVHHVGHLLGLAHSEAPTCEPASGAASPECASPPTMAVRGQGDLGPLWPADLGLFQEVHGLGGDLSTLGVVDIRPTDDWQEGQQLFTGADVPTPPGVVVVDGNDDPIPGVTVLFQILSGGGAVTDQIQVTDAEGTARLGGWTLGPTPGTHVMGASIFHQPALTELNDAAGGLERFTVEAVPPPPILVEELLPLQVGSFFDYKITVVPVGGGTPTTAMGSDVITGTTVEGNVTWYTVTGDGAFGAFCAGSSCELGLNPTDGLALLRVVTGGLTVITTPLREPIEKDRMWVDNVLSTTFDWKVEEIFESLTVEGTEYPTVVQVLGTTSASTTRVHFYYAKGVGVVRILIQSDTDTATFDLTASGVL